MLVTQWQSVLATGEGLPFYTKQQSCVLTDIPRTDSIHMSWTVDPFHLLSAYIALLFLSLDFLASMSVC